MNIVVRLLSRKYSAWTILKSSLIFLVILALLRKTPWWAPVVVVFLNELASRYYVHIRMPAIRREIVCEGMFGFINCPHGKYLPEQVCDLCANDWLKKNMVQPHEQTCPLPPAGTVFH